MTRRNSTVAKPEYYPCYGAYAKENSEEEKLYSLYNNYVGNEILDACTYRPDSINRIVDDFIYMRGLADALEDTECGSKEDLVDAVELDEIESLAYMSVGQMFYDTIETFDSWKRTHRIDELFNDTTTSSPKEVAA